MDWAEQRGDSDYGAIHRSSPVSPGADYSPPDVFAETVFRWQAERVRREGLLRDEPTVQVEISARAGALDSFEEHLQYRLRQDLGLRVKVELVQEGALAEIANIGCEDKARRLVDRRFEEGGRRDPL
ncbi:MAG TPA: hypothetical protein QF861_01980 [Alphaproteobacteria bacterium]|jgi:hypothetical protein|nr:hypothetical protein [Alphaproteobacteria bacterium]